MYAFNILSVEVLEESIWGAIPPQKNPSLSFLPSLVLEVGPLIAVRGSGGSALAPPAGPGGARPPNVF